MVPLLNVCIICLIKISIWWCATRDSSPRSKYALLFYFFFWLVCPVSRAKDKRIWNDRHYQGLLSSVSCSPRLLGDRKEQQGKQSKNDSRGDWIILWARHALLPQRGGMDCVTNGYGFSCFSFSLRPLTHLMSTRPLSIFCYFLVCIIWNARTGYLQLRNHSHSVCNHTNNLLTK